MRDRELEHPAITRALGTGYATRISFPRCPVCGNETDTLYKNRQGTVFVCDVCVNIQDAWEAEYE